MEQKMRIIGRKMSIVMGILMSFCLSLTGTLTSGHFTPVGFLISFVISTIISLLIGFILPVGKIGGDVCGKMGLKRGSIGFRLMETFILDLLYTPVITLALVFLAYKMATRDPEAAAHLSFLPIFLSSLLICFVVAYILIFIIQPIILKQFLKKEGIQQ